MLSDLKDLQWLGKSRPGFATTVVGSVLVLPANPYRAGATFVNDSAVAMYLCKGPTAVVNTGIRLNANGGSYEINKNNLWLGDISIACAGAGNILVWTEDE